MMTTPFYILVIEDDVHTMALIQTGLRGTGIAILHAPNSQDGLTLLAETPPHLILMDLLLPGPGMKGWEAIGYIKQQPEYQHIPVIAMSAGSYDIMELAQQAGCDGFLQKPFNLKELRQLIDQYRAG
jgi:CheY-like chemotaxis protein